MACGDLGTPKRTLSCQPRCPQRLAATLHGKSHARFYWNHTLQSCASGNLRATLVTLCLLLQG